MGCAVFLPSPALRAAIGLGFFGQYEGLFIGILLPMFAGIAYSPMLSLGSIIDSGDARRSARSSPILVLAAVFFNAGCGGRAVDCLCAWP